MRPRLFLSLRPQGSSSIRVQKQDRRAIRTRTTRRSGVTLLFGWEPRAETLPGYFEQLSVGKSDYEPWVSAVRIRLYARHDLTDLSTPLRIPVVPVHVGHDHVLLGLGSHQVSASSLLRFARYKGSRLRETTLSCSV